jgi:hypothetical protein
MAGVLFSVTVQAGDVYRYVDERGNTMYTDKPIPGAERVTSTAPRPPEAAARSYAAQQGAQTSQLNSSNQRIAQGQDQQRLASTVAKDLESTRKDRCKQARDHYANTINSRRLYREKGGQKGGEREYLSDAEIAQARVEAARTVETICGPQG